MKKIILLFCVGFASLMNAQNKELEQSIELPDFVITGVQSVDIPTISKMKAELMPILGTQFFNPSYQPDKLNSKKIEVPFNDAPDILKMEFPLNYMLEIGAGRYTLPKGFFSVGSTTSNIIFNGRLWTSNISDFSAFSGENVFGAALNARIFTNSNSNFLPGLVVNVDSKYERDGYNYYGSVLPNTEQVANEIMMGLGVDYYTDHYFSFAANIQYNGLSQSLANLTDNSFVGNGMIKFALPLFSIKLESKIISNNIEDDNTLSTSRNFISNFASAEIGNKGFILGGGVYYSKLESKNFFFPRVYASLQLNEFVTVKGEAGGSSDYRTYHDIFNANKFTGSAVNDSLHYIEKDFYISGSLTYEYKKYFQLIGGAEYSHFNNNYYFDEDITGIYLTTPVKDLKRICLFGKAFFHLGPFGALYAQAEFQQFTFSDDLKVPYEPMFRTELEYNYQLSSKIGLGVKYIFRYETYSDRTNTNLLDTYHNLETNISYELFERFNLKLELQNILNRDNFVFNGYNQKPFDVIAGFTYLW
ncbi:MAG: TonB-dependent receptor [Bacteroidetes bacterium]|nr:TonB-dependent receptor [Bacteroidota bacterium]